MAFAKEATRTAVAIGNIIIELRDPDPQGLETAAALYFVRVKYSNDTTETRQGDLVPHLTQAQINSLLAFMATMRTKAIAEILS